MSRPDGNHLRFSFKWQAKISELKNSQKWFGVVRQEALVQEIKTTLDTTTKKKDELVRKTENRTNNEEKLNEQSAQINRSIDALIQASNEHRQRYDAQRATHRESSDRLAEQLRQVKHVEGKKERISRNIQKLEESVANNDNK